MKSNYTLFMIVNLIAGFYISYRYSILSYLGILMIIATHKLGHYICAVIKDRNPEFTILRGRNFGIQYRGDNSILITTGGMIVNFVFFPLFVGMEIMEMDPWFLVLFIMVGSLGDVVKIIKMLRNNVDHS